MWWSWVLTAVGIAGIWLAGRRVSWSWLVLVFEEVLWMVYAVVTEQWGFFVAGLLYGAVYLKNYLGWRSPEPGS